MPVKKSKQFSKEALEMLISRIPDSSTLNNFNDTTISNDSEDEETAEECIDDEESWEEFTE